MPCDPKNYPANWKTEIRPRILERDGHCCKKCSVPNHAIVGSISRVLRAKFHAHHTARVSREWYSEPGDPATVIVLTIAHLDHDTANNADDNLAALCQKCHLYHDAKQHASARKAGRLARKNRGIAEFL